MHLRGSSYYFVTPGEHKWKRLGKDIESAKQKLKELLAEPLKLSNISVVGVERSRLVMFSRDIYRSARSNALAKNVKWDLTEQHVLDMMVAANGYCQISGLPFTNEAHGKRGLRPWMPSIDRINATGCYETGNVRLICVVANIALSDFGDEVFKKLVYAAAAHNPISSTKDK